MEEEYVLVSVSNEYEQSEKKIPLKEGRVRIAEGILSIQGEGVYMNFPASVLAALEKQL